ncbi:sugar-binding transcriptional regulator [Corynebacterium uterequi]|uniref:Transcriptional regulator n=1 Tax=Corynebacterium uterequi TaxID=1072256 RepID=A0A0G3HIG3_9CORY|nr:sugar-binding domain-containing protein [Corynebacterium uterequi]AKK11703.1 transcriptional regulator [Corynebacterium uterequi]
MRREEMAYQAAVMYYVGEETMNSIAQRLNVSRSTVSRLIREAREQGYVQIVLSKPKSTTTAASRSIAEYFNVTPHIVSVPSSANSLRAMHSVARVAGVVVSEAMHDDAAIGVAWGNTLSAVGTQLVRKPVARASVVQLNGAANPRSFGVPYAGAIMADFVEVFGCSAIHFPVPAFFDYPETREAMWRESSVSRVRERQLGCDIAVFGVGSLNSAVRSHVYTSGYFTDTELAQLKNDGVVGDVCTVMLRADGTWDGLDINRRASGPTPEELRRIPRRICVVSDPSKASATLAALRAGVATDLVLSDRAAQDLLALADGVR